MTRDEMIKRIAAVIALSRPSDVERTARRERTREKRKVRADE